MIFPPLEFQQQEGDDGHDGVVADVVDEMGGDCGDVEDPGDEDVDFAGATFSEAGPEDLVRLADPLGGAEVEPRGVGITNEDLELLGGIGRSAYDDVDVLLCARGMSTYRKRARECYSRLVSWNYHTDDKLYLQTSRPSSLVRQVHG